MTTRARRLALLLCALWLIPCVGSAGGTQSRPDLERVVSGAAARLPVDAVDVLRIRFEAGARTHWHVHESPQIFLVEEGLGRAQVRGGPLLEVRPGEPILLAANVPHWHGAAPGEAATCLQVYPCGVSITMLEEVTEADYHGGSSAPR